MALTRDQGILTGLKDDERKVFLSKCTQQSYDRGEHLCVQGGRHEDNFIIRAGVVRTYHSSPLGRAITLGYWSEEDLVGGPNFFDECVHVWSAEAVTDTVVLRISAGDFKQLATTFPGIAERVLDCLSFKLYWFSLLLQMLGTESVGRRLAHLLLLLSETHGAEVGGETVLNRHFTQEEFGAMIGVTRQWVSRALAEFKRERLLRYRKDYRMAMNLERLRAYLEQPDL